jgi:hypothetical protein
MTQNKLSARPNARSLTEQKAMDFIEAAGEINTQSKSLHKSKLPWLDPAIRSDLCKVFTLKISEDYIEKIKYISAKTNKSQQKIIREIVSEEVDRIIVTLM